MAEQGGYRTRQRDAVRAYLLSLQGAHTNAQAIAEALKQSGVSISTATVYRHLEKFVQAGEIQKNMVDGKACYHALQDAGCQSHFHLRCDDCGALVHFDCEHLTALTDHARQAHGLHLRLANTVFSGVCADCAQKKA